LYGNFNTCRNLGIEDLLEDKISVYPNPVIDGSWQIEVGNSLVGKRYSDCDANGKIIYKTVIQNTKSEIVFEAAKGIYLMRIVSKESSITRKLIRL
jgi:hypothetical protein